MELPFNDFQPFTSDKHVGWVGVKARFCVDAQSVHALVFLVEVGQSEDGTLPGPVGVHPFRGLQGDSWWKESITPESALNTSWA